MKKIPYIHKENGVTCLYVNGKPFLALGGELHNSSSSSLEYMERVVWPALRPLGLNTVVAPVFWECVEPEQGSFDYTLTDGLILQARREGVKLVLLWFGLWKNGNSTYVPEWVKTDTATYYRVRTAAGEALECISPLCNEAVEADANAYKKLMAHIRDFDREETTVIMMQVENEIGVLTSDRDYSEQAEALFRAEIPQEAADEYGVSGSWGQAFGKDAAELFMGYHYAKAVEKITAAGTAEYPIPMYVNAWLEQYPWLPGTYPSGGPVAKILKMWKLCAPTVAFYAPDIYVDYFRDVCDEYAADGNPLFIPEVRQTADAASFLFYAVGKHHALGFAPFGIEDMFAAEAGSPSEALMNALNISISAFQRDPNAGPLIAMSYKLISNMDEIIHEAHLNRQIHGFLEYNDKGTLLSLKNYDVKISYSGTLGMFGLPGDKKGGTPAGGFLIECADDEFLLAGVGFAVEFLPKPGEKAAVRLLRKEEGHFEKNRWVRGRILNGDEGYFTMMSHAPSVIRMKMYKVQ